MSIANKIIAALKKNNMTTAEVAKATGLKPADIYTPLWQLKKKKVVTRDAKTKAYALVDAKAAAPAKRGRPAKSAKITKADVIEPFKDMVDEKMIPESVAKQIFEVLTERLEESDAVIAYLERRVAALRDELRDNT